MIEIKYENSERFALSMDAQDPLSKFRDFFYIPKTQNGNEVLYFAGNSLGLQPRNAEEALARELKAWATLGVRGHFEGTYPWRSYNEDINTKSAKIVGALAHEVTVMNALTVNLHLMLVSFYQPTKTRFKILMEACSFPSDRYAICSQILFHGFDPKDALVELAPRAGEGVLRTEDILNCIDEHSDQIALVLFGNVNYLTGQAFDMAAITAKTHEHGCIASFDLAHGAGNLALKLHDWDVDFAVWCNYKYLNAGPGSPGGVFIHEKHIRRCNLPRFAGWWGHCKETRFKMPAQFDPIHTAEGWQISNNPVFQLAPLRAALEIFEQATMPAICEKRDKLTGYLEFLLAELALQVITPKSRGAQLSVRVKDGLELMKKLQSRGVVCDFREPNIIRLAPAPLYNRFIDVYQLMEVLKTIF